MMSQVSAFEINDFPRALFFADPDPGTGDDPGGGTGDDPGGSAGEGHHKKHHEKHHDKKH
ncbi:MAG TPA: hypothetical protein VGQ72_11860 [Pyrinomonadaceae bacterium]|nr:hypothetical protein [Pyrinomonadaceae bacterium]